MESRPNHGQNICNFKFEADRMSIVQGVAHRHRRSLHTFPSSLHFVLRLLLLTGLSALDKCSVNH